MTDIKPHDFRRADPIDRPRMAALASVFESFGRHASVELSTMLVAPCHLEFRRVEQTTWDQAQGRLPELVNMVLLSVAPLPGSAVFAISQRSVMAMVDLRMGGTGVETGLDRQLSEIDQALVSPVMEAALSQLARGVTKLIALRVRVSGQETNPQFVQIAGPHETCLVATFEMRLGDLPGEEVCFIQPADSLVPLLEALRPGRRAPDESGEEARRVDPAVLEHAPVEVRVRFPKVSLPSSELLGLQPGAVIALGLPKGQPLEVMVADINVAGGEPGASGRRLAVRITHDRSTMTEPTIGGAQL